MIAGLGRVLLLNGVVRSADAISRSLLLKQAALLSAFGEHIQVDIAAYDFDEGIRHAHRVSGLLELLALQEFRRADLLIYEFGIWYELFDSVRLAPEGARTMAVWHNITPPALAMNAAGCALMERSVSQMSNLWCCDYICSDSRFNAMDLDGVGYDLARTAILNLPVDSRFLELGAKPRPRNSLALLFVGRFVPAKGVIDLVRAATAAAADQYADIELALVGNLGFSDPDYIRAVQAEISAARLRIVFRGAISQADLAATYLQTDILVMPSYHEGYCLPVIEAFAAGCHVIAYDAGNLPALVGQYGELVPTGDVSRLADSLADCIGEHRRMRDAGGERAFRTGGGRVAEGQRRSMVRRYAAGFSEAVYSEEFLCCVADLFARPCLQRDGLA